MKRAILFITLVFAFSNKVDAQVNYWVKLEADYWKYKQKLISVDPGPGWKGYNLNTGQNGIALHLLNGFRINNKVFLGAGFGYVNFEGIHGYIFTGDLEYVPLKTRLSPLVNLRAGQNHIWNQYEGGSKTALIELSGGANFQLTKRWGVYLKSGLLITQDVRFMPFSLGLRYCSLKNLNE